MKKSNINVIMKTKGEKKDEKVVFYYFDGYFVTDGLRDKTMLVDCSSALDNARIAFIEEEEKTRVMLTYLNYTYKISAEVGQPTDNTIETANVHLQQFAPDGTNTRIEYKPLREILSRE